MFATLNSVAARLYISSVGFVGNIALGLVENNGNFQSYSC